MRRTAVASAPARAPASRAAPRTHAANRSAASTKFARARRAPRAVRQPDASEYVDPSQFTELELSTAQMTAYASKRPRGQFASRFADDEPRKGADILVEALEREGVDCVFAYPGGASMEIHQSLTKSATGIRNVLCRHEQGEVFAAEGYAKATGKVGVCIATSGPGGDEFGHGVGRCAVGLGADGGDHGTGAATDDRGRTRFKRRPSWRSRDRSRSTTIW